MPRNVRERRLVRQAIVLDYEGLAWQHLNPRIFFRLRPQVALLDTYYPEFVGSATCINVPGLFVHLWAIVRRAAHRVPRIARRGRAAPHAATGHFFAAPRRPHRAAPPAPARLPRRAVRWLNDRARMLGQMAPWLSPTVRQRVTTVSQEHTRSVLSQLAPYASLPKVYGGTCEVRLCLREARASPDAIAAY